VDLYSASSWTLL